MRRFLFPLLALLLLVGLTFGVGDRAYDAGYVAGFEEGAVEATSDGSGEPSDAAVRVISPGVDRGPWFGGFFLFPLLLLFLVFGGLGRRRWGRRGWGPSGPGHDSRHHLERWHRAAHGDELTDDSTATTAWPDAVSSSDS